MTPGLMTVIGLGLISLISLVSVVFLTLNQALVRQGLIYVINFAIGALLANAFVHLLPESVAHLNSPTLVGWLAIAGLLGFLILERLIRHHHCHRGNCQDHQAAWLITLSDGLHNFIDGMLIMASFLVNPAAGIGTVTAVALHEIPQEIGDVGIMLKSGWSTKKAVSINFLTSLTAFLGAGLIWWTNNQAISLAPYLLPITAGGFIYIATADLIPAIQQHRYSHLSQLAQAACLLAGLVVVGCVLK